jgi:multiple sugar transport system substrate-binding protein
MGTRGSDFKTLIQSPPDYGYTTAMFAPFRLLFILLLVLWLPGCDSTSDRAVTVEFWAMGQEGERVRALLPEFERRHPGIRVRVQQLPWSAAHEKLLTAYAGDAMPDLFQLGNTWIPEFVALRAVEPLDPRLNAWPDAALADYFPGILATNRLDGRTWALPWYVDTRLFFYRTDLLAAAGFPEPPATWQGWLDAMARLKALAGSERYAILLPINEWQVLVILALQRDATLLRDRDRYGDFRNPRFRQAFLFYLSLFEGGLAPPVSNTQMANLYQEFTNGTFAIYATGPWNIGEFGRRLPAALQPYWSTVPLPGFADTPPVKDGSTTPALGAIPPCQGREQDCPEVGVSLAGGASLALSRTSPRREAAWKLLEFLAAPEQQARFYQLTGDLPARQSAWNDPALAGNRYLQAFRRQLRHVRATPPIPEWERIANRIAYYAELAVRKRLNVDEALAALDRDVDQILEKRRWLLDRGVQPSLPAPLPPAGEGSRR